MGEVTEYSSWRAKELWAMRHLGEEVFSNTGLIYYVFTRPCGYTEVVYLDHFGTVVLREDLK
jgi:hypothetical protein